ncbi:MAG: hypothetical protein LAO77_07410 [Acidobacteriia bacterium]|nr:hypothetical protein [Terriglobia bacterium]
MRFRSIFLVALVAGLSTPAAGQSAEDAASGDQPAPTAPLSASAYVPATGAQRLTWIVDGTVGPRSLFIVGPLAVGLQTAFNMPSEWERSWNGVGKRYAEREADVAISNTIEAGLGALWGEEPRYIPSGRRGIGPRARYAIKTAFLAQRRDGRLAPAWGRYAGNVVNNLIENAWLPPSATTPGQTISRSVLGLLGRLGGNAWEEFWPDARRLLTKK